MYHRNIINLYYIFVDHVKHYNFFDLTKVGGSEIHQCFDSKMKSPRSASWGFVFVRYRCAHRRTTPAGPPLARTLRPLCRPPGNLVTFR